MTRPDLLASACRKRAGLACLTLLCLAACDGGRHVRPDDVRDFGALPEDARMDEIRVVPGESGAAARLLLPGRGQDWYVSLDAPGAGLVAVAPGAERASSEKSLPQLAIESLFAGRCESFHTAGSAVAALVRGRDDRVTLAWANDSRVSRETFPPKNDGLRVSQIPDRWEFPALRSQLLGTADERVTGPDAPRLRRLLHGSVQVRSDGAVFALLAWDRQIILDGILTRPTRSSAAEVEMCLAKGDRARRLPLAWPDDSFVHEAAAVVGADGRFWLVTNESDVAGITWISDAGEIGPFRVLTGRSGRSRAMMEHFRLAPHGDGVLAAWLDTRNSRLEGFAGFITRSRTVDRQVAVRTVTQTQMGREVLLSPVKQQASALVATTTASGTVVAWTLRPLNPTDGLEVDKTRPARLQAIVLPAP